MALLACLTIDPFAVAADAGCRADPSWHEWLAREAAGFTGAVLVACGDAVVVEAAFGMADEATGRRNAADTRFNLGSISKTFTAIAIAQLIQQGKLSPDDTLARHMPGFPDRAAAARIRIRDLLSHRSGVAQFMGGGFGDVSVAEMAMKVAAQPLEFEPGTRQRYSNGGYVLLGRLVELLSGRDYAGYVQEHIYRPAGMTASGFVRGGESPDDIAFPAADAGAPRPAARSGSPAGGGYSTVADLHRFARALREGRLLDARMTQYVLAGTFAEEPRWGFAMREQLAGAHRFVGNAGGAPGVNAEFRFEPAGRWTIVVLANASPPMASELMKAILERVAGATAAAPATAPRY